MPLPLADVLRDRPPVPGAEPMPGIPSPPPGSPPPPPPDMAPPSVEGGLGEMRRGAGLQQQAIDRALAEREALEAQRQALMAGHEERSAPLYAAQTEALNRPQPEPERPPALPLPPDQEIRPFLTGTPGEPAEQSLMKAVMGLSVLAQMGFGAASGVPELSLRTLAGAMQGWQEGDMLRGDRAFKEWQGTVATLEKDYDNRRQLVEDIVQRNRGDVERTRIALLTELARHGASQQELRAATESADAFFAIHSKQGELVRELGGTEASIAVQLEARQRQYQMDALKLEQWIADHKLKIESGQRADVREGRIASAQEESNRLVREAMGGGVPGGAAGDRGYDTSINVSPRGTSVNLTPKKLGETAQKDLRSYDSILNTIAEIKRTFKPEELEAFTGIVQRAGKDTQQFVGSLVPGVSDKRFAMYKTLTARLQSSAFEVGGKQLTPFEYSVIEKITPTGTEMGGWTEYEAKMQGLEKFTRARKAATLHYSQRGLDPASVNNAEWDQAMNAALQAEGMPAPANRPGASPPPAAAPSGGRLTPEQRAALKAKGYTDAQIDQAYGQ